MRHLTNLAALILGLSLYGCGSSSVAPADCPQGRPIVGYFPEWQGEVLDIQFELLTHIMYSFVLPNPDGTLIPMTEETEARLLDLVDMAEGHDVKLGIALGGWNDDDDSGFVALADDPATRAVFVQEVVDFITDYGLDGVDMDWEYPSTPTQAENFVLLMNEMREALDAMDGEKFLTAAVVASGDHNGQHIRDEVFDVVDFLNLMAYDEWFRPGTWDENNHSTMEYAQGSLDYWVDQRGLPREKAVLGVPFYARGESDYGPSYGDILAAGGDEQACMNVYDQAGDGSDNRYYNGIPKIRAKAELAQERACGIMMWELTQDVRDDRSLLRALWEVANDEEPTYTSCDD